MTAYSGFGPTGVYDVVTADEHGESMVYAGELADGYGENGFKDQTVLEPEQAADRVWAGMLEHERPIGMVAGDAGQHWGHVCDVARSLIERTTGKQMKFRDGAEWMGVIIEVDPASITPRRVRSFVHELGGESERLVVSLWAAGDTGLAERWITTLYPPHPPKNPPTEVVLSIDCPQCEQPAGLRCVKPDGSATFRQHQSRILTCGYEPPPPAPVPQLLCCFFDGEVDRARIMRPYRVLERREPARGRGVLLLDRRRRLF